MQIDDFVRTLTPVQKAALLVWLDEGGDSCAPELLAEACREQLHEEQPELLSRAETALEAVWDDPDADESATIAFVEGLK